MKKGDETKRIRVCRRQQEALKTVMFNGSAGSTLALETNNIKNVPPSTTRTSPQATVAGMPH